jgi:hypothetical protein
MQAIRTKIEHIPLLFPFMLEWQSLDKCEETGVIHWLPGLLPETHVSIVLHIVVGDYHSTLQFPKRKFYRVA